MLWLMDHRVHYYVTLVILKVGTTIVREERPRGIRPIIHHPSSSLDFSGNGVLPGTPLAEQSSFQLTGSILSYFG